ncbi:putative PGG domain-containing protein [Helianthus debilis subsp. tardiflorus]
MLHLAGRLAPTNKLKLITGAALQLQRELQWREEVKKMVYPSMVTEENIFNDTPEMVFAKEHQDLVKDGKEWIKTVAESSSITATLIITIVFAAAITVPGGNRENGVPVFLEEAAFIIFAISDAISLFSSTTALLLFLSILTARFAQEDFLVRLPRRLIIGLYALLISTAAMMVAFGATLFLVFCRDKIWMLAPICGLAFLPIAVFCYLQVPLMIDLWQSTYISMFGMDNHNNSELDPDDMRVHLW